MALFFSSLTRITDFPSAQFSISKLERSHWATGDFIAATLDPGQRQWIELNSGRRTEMFGDDTVVGALGVRAATLEVVGDWQHVNENGAMQALSSAGLFGQMTSMSCFLPPLSQFRYQGHILLDGQKASMRDFVRPAECAPYQGPVVILVGTSMSAGKTTSARTIIRKLAGQGKRVVGAKLTGTGRYRDTLAMYDSGAAAVFDFVDVGLPSTICDKAEYADALETLLSYIGQQDPDVLVAEIGASPMEPYNGSVAVERLEEQIRLTVLCASDPFAVLGVIHAYQRSPDLVAGVATSTEAGIDLIGKLSGLPAINLLERSADAPLTQLLEQAL